MNKKDKENFITFQIKLTEITKKDTRKRVIIDHALNF